MADKVDFTRTTTCPLCGGPLRQIGGCWDDPTKDLHLCQPCQLGVRQPLPTLDECRTYYERAYREGHAFGDTPTDYHTKKDVLLKARLHQLTPYLGPGQVLLDIGCGTGRFMEMASAEGPRFQGVEPYEPYAAYARDAGFVVRTGCIEDLDLVQNYHGFCLFHLVEHLRDPVAVLRRLRQHATEGARLFIEVPSLHDGFYLYKFPPEVRRFSSPHLWYFTTASLTRVIEEAGWTVTRQLPYQRAGLLAHLFHMNHNGRYLVDQSQTWTPECIVQPGMERILTQIEGTYRATLTSAGLADTLLTVAVNAEA